MNFSKHIVKNGSDNKLIALDVHFKSSNFQKPIILFVHGFKGFKDWGHWSVIAKTFAEAGYVFIKFNFTHNGTSPSQLLDFVDLEAFGQNNYMKEMHDLDCVISWISSTKNPIPSNEMDTNNITLIGHSRGGGISILKAYHDTRIKQVITWASVHRMDYSSYFLEKDNIKKWQEEGVIYIKNGRTKQNMPLYFQLYETFKENETYLNVEKACKNMNKPMLIIQGTADPAIPVSSAQSLKTWNPNATLHLIENANHVFGGSHPFNGENLPEHSQELMEVCLEFLK